MYYRHMQMLFFNVYLFRRWYSPKWLQSSSSICSSRWWLVSTLLLTPTRPAVMCTTWANARFCSGSTRTTNANATTSGKIPPKVNNSPRFIFHKTHQVMAIGIQGLQKLPWFHCKYTVLVYSKSYYKNCNCSTLRFFFQTEHTNNFTNNRSRNHILWIG